VAGAGLGFDARVSPANFYFISFFPVGGASLAPPHMAAAGLRGDAVKLLPVLLPGLLMRRACLESPPFI